jgi:hypothetical protein
MHRWIKGSIPLILIIGSYFYTFCTHCIIVVIFLNISSFFFGSFYEYLERFRLQFVAKLEIDVLFCNELIYFFFSNPNTASWKTIGKGVVSGILSKVGYDCHEAENIRTQPLRLDLYKQFLDDLGPDATVEEKAIA